MGDFGIGERSNIGVYSYFLKFNPVKPLKSNFAFDLLFDGFLFGVGLSFLEEFGSVMILLYVFGEECILFVLPPPKLFKVKSYYLEFPPPTES